MLIDVDYSVLDFARQTAQRIMEKIPPSAISYNTQIQLLEECIEYIDLLVNTRYFPDVDLELEYNYSLATKKIISDMNEILAVFTINDSMISFNCIGKSLDDEKTKHNRFDEFSYSLSYTGERIIEGDFDLAKLHYDKLINMDRKDIIYEVVFDA